MNNSSSSFSFLGGVTFSSLGLVVIAGGGALVYAGTGGACVFIGVVEGDVVGSCAACGLTHPAKSRTNMN